MKSRSKKNIIQKQTRLINRNTGEILRTSYEESEGTFDEDKGYLWWKKKNFAKTFQEIKFPPGMNFTDIGRLTVLSKHIWANTNMLGYRSYGGVKPYTREQIYAIVGLKPRQGFTWLSKMEQEGIIKAIPIQFPDYTEIQYYMNPVYYYSSNRLSLNLYLIFREELDAHLPQWVKEEFGILADKEIGID